MGRDLDLDFVRVVTKVLPYSLQSLRAISDLDADLFQPGRAFGRVDEKHW